MYEQPLVVRPCLSHASNANIRSTTTTTTRRRRRLRQQLVESRQTVPCAVYVVYTANGGRRRRRRRRQRLVGATFITGAAYLKINAASLGCPHKPFLMTAVSTLRGSVGRSRIVDRPNFATLSISSSSSRCRHRPPRNPLLSSL